MARDKLFDSLKFLLICLVVFGHTIDTSTTKFDHILFGFLYTFHMPLFIFISGYFSKNITWKKYKKFFIGLSITFTIFQFIYSIPSMFLGFENWLQVFIRPKGWYILGLFLWRFIYVIVKGRISIINLLIISFLVPIILGFLPFNIEFFRLITFFPYFVLGVLSSKITMVRIRKINKFYSILYLIILFVFIYKNMDIRYRLSLFGEGSYLVYFQSNLVGLFYRLQAYLLAIITSIAVINLTPQNIGKYGTKTLEIYLMHFIFEVIIYSIIFPRFSIQPNLLINIISTIIIITLCIYISNFRIIQFIMHPLDFFNSNYNKKNR